MIVSSEDALRDLRSFLPDARVPMHVLRFVSNPADVARIPSAQTLRERYALPPEYFHLPNQFWTHKNHWVVVDALGVLKAQGRHALVVCTGSTSDVRSPHHFSQLMAHAQDIGVADMFKVLGVVPYHDAQALMAHATAVINPSRFEGWSTTVEEAKTLGRPLLLSNLSVHREQSPQHGRFFDPDDPHALADLMTAAMAYPCPLASADDITASYQRRSATFAHRYLGIVQETLS